MIGTGFLSGKIGILYYLKDLVERKGVKTIHDLACGSGDLGFLIKKLNLEVKVIGYDISEVGPKHYDEYKKLDLTEEFDLVRFNENEDAVVMSEVIEHLTEIEVEDLIGNLLKLNISNLVISTPFISYVQHYKDQPEQTHKTHWDRSCLQRISKSSILTPEGIGVYRLNMELIKEIPKLLRYVPSNLTMKDVLLMRNYEFGKLDWNVEITESWSKINNYFIKRLINNK